MKTVDPLHGVAAFLAVAERESFTGAAEALGLTRSTVSAQVADLEARLGLRLFHRSTRIVRMTAAGQAYRDRLGDLAERVDLAERAARAEHSAPEGRLRITAPPDLAQRFLLPWVAEFLAGHPGIRIELDLSNAAHNLIERRLDLAIRGTIAVEPNLITRKLGVSPLLTCAHPDYIARRGQPETPADLADHDLLHFASLRRGRIWTMTRGPERVEVPILPRLELNEGWALRTAALEATGICQLPAFIVGELLRAGDLVHVLPEWSAGEVPLHAVYPDNRLIAERVRAFVSFIARKAKGEPDLGGGQAA
ncbi:LysR family transcriptional regulator [Silicimonas algicola]|uniref:DNA-binding transcriptional LysR family regulator n=1 Tax=Silicimonas algicola TaxID=1826607 RepID=A0A316GDF6_9RHOB|nr:LysR family transcriptional regulator [Silicimonas algicola]AZQ66601.1 LysR family transcriptional regulator [Silicimonas algicola]PWK58944.1 DNA-binding transcriptional LysR family regulator [Silicimonas algicola]